MADFGWKAVGIYLEDYVRRDRQRAIERSKSFHERNLLIVESIGIIAFVHQKPDAPFAGDLGLADIEIFGYLPATNLEIGVDLYAFQGDGVVQIIGILVTDSTGVAEIPYK